MKRWKSNPSCAGEQHSAHSGQGTGSLERGAHQVSKVMELWHESVEDGDLLSSWLCQSFWNDTVIHQGEEGRWLFHLGAGTNPYLPIGKGDKKGLNSLEFPADLLGSTRLACFAQGEEGLGWYYLGEYQVFHTEQEVSWENSHTKDRKYIH